jgi:hypothetical protein
MYIWRRRRRRRRRVTRKPDLFSSFWVVLCQALLLQVESPS